MNTNTHKLNLSDYGVKEMNRKALRQIRGGNLIRAISWGITIMRMMLGGGASPYRGPIPKTDNTYVHIQIR